MAVTLWARRMLTAAALALMGALILALGQAPSPPTRTPGPATATDGDPLDPDSLAVQAAPTRGARARGEAVQLPPPRSLTLVATGDVLLHDALWHQARADAVAAGRPGEHDFGPLLAGIRPLVQEADVAICHMETPVAPRGGPYASYPSFSVPPEIVPALAATGFDACTTASNHTYDRGAAGVDRTLHELDAAGIHHAGSARTP
jgi:hypothetical protein